MQQFVSQSNSQLFQALFHCVTLRLGHIVRQDLMELLMEHTNLFHCLFRLFQGLNDTHTMVPLIHFYRDIALCTELF